MIKTRTKKRNRNGNAFGMRSEFIHFIFFILFLESVLHFIIIFCALKDTFKTQIMERELSRRREVVPKRKGVIREELPSRTWVADMDLDEKLGAKRIKQGGSPTMWLKKLRLHIDSVRVDSADAEDDSYHFVLSGEGVSPWMANAVRVDGQYHPFMEQDNVSLTIQPKVCKVT